MSVAKEASGPVSTGVEGLDSILGGGLTPERLYLLEGSPGAGKTTIGLQFLLEGVKRKERVLYVSLSETETELRAVAQAHGWNLDGIHIRELIPSEQSLRPDEQYTMFHPSEVELGETTQSILDEAERVRPSRVVFDSLTEMRMLAGHPLRFRRQILAIKQFLLNRRATVIMLDDRTDHDVQLHTLAHGVISLEQTHPEYGRERRRMRILKYRGVAFRGGYHDFVIATGGVKAFPRLVAAEHRHTADRPLLSSGIPELDTLLGGGIECGTSTLIAGAAGSGKSSLATTFAYNVARQGKRAAIFAFDESVPTLVSRSSGLGMDLQPYIDSGHLRVQPVDPAELSPGQFAHAIKNAATQPETALLVIDSLNGYLHAMPEERFLAAQLHELLAYLGHLGVATILVGVHQGLIGSAMQSPVDASYLADCVILLRYFESRGEVRQAMSIMKKRGGNHERTIREYQLGAGGFRVGEPLREFRGVLTGVPVYEGASEPLLKTSAAP